jgi:16S rRNA (cytosine1402-N4)-methyltransferase
VLVNEVLAHLGPEDRVPRLVVDGTVGLGGHAEAMLDAWPGVRVLGLDRDAESLSLCRERLARHGARVRLFHASYADLSQVVAEAGEGRPDGVLLDLGASSLHLDDASRGFSFRALDVPADMRFDREGGGPTAADLANRLPVEALARLLREEGGERRSRAVARAIVDARPIATVGDLVRAVARVVRRDASGIDPATRTFQALRIAVNDERGHLERGLRAALEAPGPGGRVAAISFHGGEDGAVKRAFQDAQARGVARVVTRKPVRPTEREVSENPRARSARLRVAEVGQAEVGEAEGGGGGRST